ncbi:hypothetical protein GQ53DRAFT_775399 [Thozetella sp. PMI_491]|nr:hypothetical protein GQ53DRAFT_775399 [Thozetella sp. PMI_491]
MAHHELFKALGPIDWADLENEADSALSDLLDGTFAQAQTLVDSIPDAPATSPVQQARASGRARSQTDSAVDGRPSLDVSSRPSPAIAAQLRKEWRDIKVNPRDNPLAISVYKLASKDGKGAWFARRSMHEGLPFEKWKLGLEREFAETLKIGGAQQVVEPGAGNVRGIGAERRVARKIAGGKGKAEVFQLSIRFPGPTTPRDFVALLLSSSSSSSSDPSSETTEKSEVPRRPRQFMVVSKPCAHPDCPPRPGFIRGQYESVEIIREIPVEKPLRRTRSSIDITREDIQSAAGGATNLSREAMIRSARNTGSDTEPPLGRGVSFAVPPQDSSEEPEMAIEWLMITRSDPGGSVPRFMVEKGTPGGIVSDAGKFLKWLSAKSTEDFAHDDGNEFKEEALAAEQTDPAGFAKAQAPSQNLQADPVARTEAREAAAAPSGFYNMIAGALGAAGSAVASRMPVLVTSARGSSEEEDVDDESDTSSETSYASAEEGEPSSAAPSSVLTSKDPEPALSLRSGISDESQALSSIPTQHEKELKKLQERRSKMQEKINRMAERVAAKKREDSDKDAASLVKLREKHERDLARQEEKYQRDLKKLEEKRAQEERKAQERRRKQTEREERANIQLELDRVRLERDVARKEMEVLKDQIGELQAQNTLLVAKLGKLGALGRSDSWHDVAGRKPGQELPNGVSA